MQQAIVKKPVARKLLLKLLGSRENIQMNAASAVRVGALFGISENNIRVTLTRLQSMQLITLVERGYYALGENGKQFAKEISQWRSAEDSLMSWGNDWVVAQTNTLPKSDKKQQRTNERALKLVGMRKLVSDMYIRPNNILDGAKGVRGKLQTLGLSKKVMVFSATDFEDKMHNKAMELWRQDDLEGLYRNGCEEIEQSLKHLHRLPLEEATKESYVVGDSALYRLVFDPLLPSPLVDVALRKRYRDLVKHYDDVGAEIWHRFLSKN
ncbi:MAG: PaaX family transcriptional regulator [Gammaproteobacteria bacterium]|uniref:PaaX family transcriptional regulator n=1 Tax=Alteromonas mediterranea TaxID=314275 RepID=UPI000E9FBAD9|nr:PaaX family transcriptional regulator [Gammaproteobacteria bacterium]HBL19701.1 PaaX family transcriptional regulator [Alteromonas mediterranea]